MSFHLEREEASYCLLCRITLATVDVTISCIIKVGRIQFFGTVKTCQTRFMIQITFGHYFFCFIHYSMAFWARFKTSLWTFDSCCFQRWGIIRPIFKVLNIFNIARFAVDFLLKEIYNLMKLFMFSINVVNVMPTLKST